MNHTFKFAAIGGEALRGMPLLSPCEARDALVFRIDEAIQDGADEETLKLWKAAAENAPICIVRCEKSEIQWRQINERESVGKSFKLLYRTAIGRMFEVLDVIMAHERANGVELSAKEVAELWNLHVGDAEIGEKVTDTYVIALQKIRRRIIQDKAAITKLLAADEEFGVVGTPWDSIYKLESLATKIGNRENSDKLLFLIDYIYDRMKSGNVDRADLSSRSMAGKGKPGNKGILDLGLLKYDMVRHALGTLLEDIPGDTRMKETVREVFGSFQTYRSAFGYPTDSEIMSNPWMSLINHQLQKFSELFKEAVYEANLDSGLLNLLRAGRSAQEVFEEGPLGDKFKELKEAIAAEAGKTLQNIEDPVAPDVPVTHAFTLALNISPAAKTPDVKAAMRVKAMTNDERDDLRYYEKLALTKIADNSEWVIEQSTVKQMAEAIRNTEYGKARWGR